MSINQNTDLNVGNNHINKKYNVLFCYPNCLCYNQTNYNICISYIDENSLYTNNTIYSDYNINTNNFICYDQSNPNQLYTAYVDINSGIVKTSDNYNNTNNYISTKRYVDYRLYVQVMKLAKDIQTSYDVLTSVTTNATNITSNIKQINGFSVYSRDGEGNKSASLTTSTFKKNSGSLYIKNTL